MMWLEVSVMADIAAVEALSSLFTQHGEGGTAVEEPFFTDAEGEHYGIDTARPARISTYLPNTSEGAERLKRIEEGLWHLSAFGLAPIGSLQTRPVDEADWANAWKEHYHPIRVGRLLVRPSWLEVPVEPGVVEVQIDPGMAFGTGIHQTTRMCLTALERYLVPGTVVIDQGTGSGILAVSAARLGAREVWARDIAEVAVEATLENARRNGVEACLHVQLVSANSTPAAQVLLSADQPAADLILANIIANVLIRLAPSFVEASRPGSRLIASGIIRERVDEVVEALAAAGYVLEERLQEDEWVTLVVTLVTSPSPAAS
jgi:ribosomal protein L11 methyltransferase